MNLNLVVITYIQNLKIKFKTKPLIYPRNKMIYNLI